METSISQRKQIIERGFKAKTASRAAPPQIETSNGDVKMNGVDDTSSPTEAPKAADPPTISIPPALFAKDEKLQNMERVRRHTELVYTLYNPFSLAKADLFVAGIKIGLQTIPAFIQQNWNWRCRKTSRGDKKGCRQINGAGTY